MHYTPARLGTWLGSRFSAASKRALIFQALLIVFTDPNRIEEEEERGKNDDERGRERNEEDTVASAVKCPCVVKTIDAVLPR